MSSTKDGNERGTSITADNIRAVRDLIEEDQRVTISDIASHVGISFGSVQAIISDELKFRKLSASVALFTRVNISPGCCYYLEKRTYDAENMCNNSVTSSYRNINEHLVDHSALAYKVKSQIRLAG
ncbi:hypothetical protein ANN_09685 [Periplaneta americana]|uniref:Uncharacterized protein n=1 Tax=Periplaneta americana TaxID=6978 RepID=A0ABQ8TP99_PERAM|nr:hypothetical protein ANN_09685 [Periplaneta americana]